MQNRRSFFKKSMIGAAAIAGYGVIGCKSKSENKLVIENEDEVEEVKLSLASGHCTRHFLLKNWIL